jgi:hypothetical protein
MWFSWVARAVELGAIVPNAHLLRMFPGLKTRAPPAVPPPLAVLRRSLCDDNGCLPDQQMHEYFWNVRTRNFEHPGDVVQKAIKLNARVWTRAEFREWLQLASHDIDHGLLRHTCHARRETTLCAAVGRSMQLEQIRVITSLTPDEALDMFSSQPWAIRGHDAWQAYQWDIHYYDQWNEELLDYWACSIDAGDPRVLIHIWHATQRPNQGDDEVSPVFGLLQGLMRRAPVDTTVGWDAFLKRLFECPSGNVLQPTMAPYLDKDLTTLYFEPSVTRNEDNLPEVSPKGLEDAKGAAAGAVDPDLIFQRAFVMAARGVSFVEHQMAKRVPVLKQLLDAHRLVHRTFVLCRSGPAAQKVGNHLVAHPTLFSRFAGYDFFRDVTWKGTTSEGRARADWQGTLFVLYAKDNTWGESVFDWFYGRDSVPPDLALEEDYENWDFPVDDMAAHIRVTHTNVFRSYVASQYFVPGGDNTAPIPKPVKLQHVERMMPLLVLRHV